MLTYNQQKTIITACLVFTLLGCNNPVNVRISDLPPLDPAQIKDAVPKYEPKTSAGNPPTYVVFGKRYYLMNKNRGYVRRGIASWYGPKFHGRRTSNGEIYNMYDMTAAHKTLRIPSYVRVHNLENDRIIIVRVNDRGPFIGNRVIDLSYAAAYKLGMLKKGTAFVQIEVVEPGHDNQPILVDKHKPESPHAVDEPKIENALPLVSELPKFDTVRPLTAETSAQQPQIASTYLNKPARTKPPKTAPLTSTPDYRQNNLANTTSSNDQSYQQPTTAPSTVPANPETIRVYIQLGAFKVRWNAQKLYNKLWKLSYPYLSIHRSLSTRSKPIYRVRIGPLTRVAQVDRIANDLARNGFKKTQVVVID